MILYDMDNQVVVSCIFLHVHPECWGNVIQFDQHIFQIGWFNHQLVKMRIFNGVSSMSQQVH